MQSPVLHLKWEALYRKDARPHACTHTHTHTKSHTHTDCGGDKDLIASLKKVFLEKMSFERIVSTEKKGNIHN